MDIYFVQVGVTLHTKRKTERKKITTEHKVYVENNVLSLFKITTDVVSSNLDQGEVYNIMW
jgi:hypothetical protein